MSDQSRAGDRAGGVNYETAVAHWVARNVAAGRELDPAKITDVRFGTHEGDSCPTCGYDGYGEITWAYDGERGWGTRWMVGEGEEIPFARLVQEIVAIAAEFEGAA